MLDNRLHPSQPFNEFCTFSNSLRNWKSVSNIYSKRKLTNLEEIKSYLQKYFINHMYIINQHCKKDSFIDRQTFDNILRRYFLRQICNIFLHYFMYKL